MRAEAARRHWGVEIHNARKNPINDRIRFYCIIMGADKYRLMRSCAVTIDALSTAMWHPKVDNVRLDDGTTNIDNLDAQEYSTEPFMREIIERR